MMSFVTTQPAAGSASDLDQGADHIERSFRQLAGDLDPHSSTPLYKQVHLEVERWIEEGRLLPGDRLISERRLTELLGVSRRTIRAALGELIERKYVEATHGRGNFVLTPSRLREMRYLALERFLPDNWSKAYHYDLIHEAEAKTNAVVHYKYAPSLEKLAEILKDPPSGYDGILIVRPSQDWIDGLRHLESQLGNALPLPLIIVSRDLQDTSYHFVSPDHRKQGYDAARRLIKLGHRRIAYISGMLHAEYMRLSLDGFLQALSEEGITPTEEDLLLLDSMEADRVQQAIAPFVTNRKFTALVVAGSAFSIPFERVIGQEKIQVPEELSVVLISEEHILDQLDFSWSANVYPDHEVMKRSLDVLADLARGHRHETVQEFIGHFVREGASCGQEKER